MGYYTGEDLPVYDHLAEEYCVVDRWFSSVPGATWPNRLYAVAGQAAGTRDDISLPIYALPSFCRYLDEHEVQWRWYSFDPGTLRAVDPQTRQLLATEVRHLAEGIAAAHGLTATVQLTLGPPPIVNPIETASWARSATVAVLGPAALVPLGFVNMAAEDFAYYMERMPGCFLRVGAREAGSEAIPAHTPRFYAADASIFVGGAVLAETARVTSAALGGS